jgi:ATP-dependent RNA helicase DDX52/ROK1
MGGDAFALLRAGTSFDRAIQNESEKSTGASRGPEKKRVVDELPAELDFFGDQPRNEEKQGKSGKQTKTISETKSKKRKRHEKPSEVDIEDRIHLRKIYRINVTGENPPPPLSSFNDLAQYNPADYLISNISELNFDTPTPIQMQSISIILDKRDLLACAPTGSGKTLAYLIPLLMNLKSHKSGGFRAVIISPTRELAQQVSPLRSRLLNMY